MNNFSETSRVIPELKQACKTGRACLSTSLSEKNTAETGCGPMSTAQPPQSRISVIWALSFLPSALPQSLVTMCLIIPHLLGYLFFSPELIRRIMLGKVELCEAPVLTSGEVVEDGPFIRAGSWNSRGRCEAPVVTSGEVVEDGPSMRAGSWNSRGGNVCSYPDFHECASWWACVISHPVLMAVLLPGLRRHWPYLRNHPSRNGCHSLLGLDI